MSMNSFSWKMNSSHRRKRSEDGENTSSITITKTLTKLEGLSEEFVRDARRQPLKTIDLDVLKKTYADVPNLGRRVAPRFPLQIAVIAYGPTATFRTQSLNVSATGTLLKDALPAELMNRSFDLLFVYNHPQTGERMSLMFKARAVGMSHEGARIAFESAGPQALDVLRGLVKGMKPIP